jgi:transcriptional regulator with XRE-family HTH domain
MLNELLRQARLSRGLTQQELAQRAAVSTTQICYIEQGDRVPSPALLLKITEQLNVSSEDWLPAYLARETRVGTLIQLIDLLLASHRYPEGQKVLRVALSRNRHDYSSRYNHELYHLAGKVNWHRGRYRMAVVWFGRMARHLPHATTLTRGIALYDYGMALYLAGRFSEAFHQLQQAQALFGASRQHYRGLANWALAACLFDQYRYRESRYYFHRAAKDLSQPPHAGEVMFGLLLTNWIVAPGFDTLQPLVEFEQQHRPLPDALRGRWLLAMAIIHRLSQQPDTALSYVQQIDRNSTDPNDYAEALAESALCALELRKPGEVQKWLVAFDHDHHVASEASESVRWFMFLLEHILAECKLPSRALPITEGYDRRIHRLMELVHGQLS